MSQISCDVIRDLLVLYEDDVCSKDSCRIIEEHIKSCPDCQKLYETMKKPIPSITLSKNTVEASENPEKDSVDEFYELASNTLKKVERKLTYRHIIILGIVLFFLAVTNILWSDLIKDRINIVPSEDIKVTELYKLKNGDIYCTLTCKDVFTKVNADPIHVPEGMNTKDYNRGWHEIYFQYPLPLENQTNKIVYGNEISVVFPLEDNFSLDKDTSRTHLCTSIYYTGKGKNNRILIWKKGQDIEPAPQKIEDKVEIENNYYEYYYGQDDPGLISSYPYIMTNN